MAKITHDMRLLDLLTPLGKDVLLIRSINGREALSQLYSYEVESFAPITTDVDFADLIGQPLTVSVTVFGFENPIFASVSSVSGSSSSPVKTRLPVAPVSVPALSKSCA